jgi:UDP-N-acetylmuramoylalanine--D-glutamate ligase
MNRKTVLIGGGVDKEADYTDWIKSFDGKVKALILLGETKGKIMDTANRCGFHESILVSSLKEAVKKASETAAAGDAVLLSPACASWDMFASYEQRGNMFKQYVNDLE